MLFPESMQGFLRPNIGAYWDPSRHKLLTSLKNLRANLYDLFIIHKNKLNKNLYKAWIYKNLYCAESNTVFNTLFYNSNQLLSTQYKSYN